MTTFYRYFYFLLFALSISCSRSKRSSESGSEASPTTADLRSTEKVEVRYARGFNVSYHQGYKQLDILNPYQDQADTLHYLLVPRGEQPPQLPIDAQVIEIPVRSIIATSTTHLALTEALDANSIVKGVTQPDYVFSKEIRNRLRQGRIKGFKGGEFNKELALSLDPDLIMLSGGQASQFDNFRVLQNSGIDILANSEWMEQTPLGKAEWIKMMGVLLNKEALANHKFEEVANRYNELKQKVGKITEKPLVINNMPYKGAWFVSGGDSFTAQFFKDAGADYAWFDNSETGGLRLDFEAVYSVGLRADIWLNPGSAETREDILAEDSRLGDFKSFKTGRIYNNNRRMSPSGGNDYWESGVVHPEIVLADLIKILHPYVSLDHNLYYYQKVE